MKLAIKGHSTRGKEVIKLLEMIGGVNPFLNNGEVIGNKESHCYYISENATLKYISWDYIGPEEINEYKIFTLEEFLEKYPFKVGDKVISIYGKFSKISRLIWSKRDNEVKYELENDVDSLYYTSELQPYKEETIEEINIDKIGFNGDKARLILPDEYEFKTEGNEVFIIKKKPKYPKTYKECCEIIDYHLEGATIIGYEKPLLENLQQLLICRDAYWKIAGEQMGLGKSWEPDWKNLEQEKHCIWFDVGRITLQNGYRCQHILVFPTEEMRDAFYENFKDLIEQCKELL